MCKSSIGSGQPTLPTNAATATVTSTSAAILRLGQLDVVAARAKRSVHAVGQPRSSIGMLMRRPPATIDSRDADDLPRSDQPASERNAIMPPTATISEPMATCAVVIIGLQ